MVVQVELKTGRVVSVVSKEEIPLVLPARELEMDKGIVSVVKESINKAREEKLPIARYDKRLKRAYLDGAASKVH